jgi:hypothetical protein
MRSRRDQNIDEVELYWRRSIPFTRGRCFYTKEQLVKELVTADQVVMFKRKGQCRFLTFSSLIESL